MRSAETQAVALAAMLAAVTGGEPRTEETDSGAIRIEADIPDELKPTTRSAILHALSLADRYGHQRSAGGEVVWAELDDRGTEQ